MLLAISIICFVIVFILSVHHLLIHANSPPPDGLTGLCLLQPKDFGASRCTHENWIMLFVLAGCILLVCSAAVE